MTEDEDPPRREKKMPTAGDEVTSEPPSIPLARPLSPTLEKNDLDDFVPSGQDQAILTPDPRYQVVNDMISFQLLLKVNHTRQRHKPQDPYCQILIKRVIGDECPLVEDQGPPQREKKHTTVRPSGRMCPRWEKSSKVRRFVMMEDQDPPRREKKMPTTRDEGLLRWKIKARHGD
ncbi:hypothetical protein GW17_00035869 [Ensete ventricosum]|nr:hypothetical protein GW17_00035869 [Ensete ventricosum]